MQKKYYLMPETERVIWREGRPWVYIGCPSVTHPREADAAAKLFVEVLNDRTADQTGSCEVAESLFNMNWRQAGCGYPVEGSLAANAFKIVCCGRTFNVAITEEG